MKKALVAALVAATFIAPAGAFAQVGGESGDERIVAAREALRKGDRDTLERLAAMRETHPLDAYPRYWLLINRLARADEPVPVATLQAFFAEGPAPASPSACVPTGCAASPGTATGAASSTHTPTCATPTPSCAATPGPRAC